MLSDSISDRTIVLLLPWLQTINKINLPELIIRIFQFACFLCLCAYGYVAARLLFRLICNLPEWRIRIFQSAYFLCPGYESEDIKVALSEFNRKNRVERNEKLKNKSEKSKC